MIKIHEYIPRKLLKSDSFFSIYSRTSTFRILVVVVVVVMFSFSKHISKTVIGIYGDETLYTDRIPLPGVQRHIEIFVNNVVSLRSIESHHHCPRTLHH